MRAFPTAARGSRAGMPSTRVPSHSDQSTSRVLERVVFVGLLRPILSLRSAGVAGFPPSQLNEMLRLGNNRGSGSCPDNCRHLTRSDTDLPICSDRTLLTPSAPASTRSHSHEKARSIIDERRGTPSTGRNHQDCTGNRSSISLPTVR